MLCFFYGKVMLHKFAVRMAKRPAKIPSHGIRALIAFLRQLFERPADDHRNGRADLCLLLDGLGFLHQVHHSDRNSRFALKRNVPRQHLIENDAHGIQVAGGCRLHAFRLLRREVMH